MTQVLRVRSDEIVSEFRKWLPNQAPLSLVVIEGLPSAGKSTLLEGLTDVATRIELDKLLIANGPNDVAWSDRVRGEGGLREKLQSALGSHRLVVVEGPAAWPVVEEAHSLPRSEVRRVYLKRLSMSGGVPSWLDGDGLAEHAAGCAPYYRDIYEYHASEPWRLADLIVERLVEKQPTPQSEFLDLTGREWNEDS